MSYPTNYLVRGRRWRRRGGGERKGRRKRHAKTGFTLSRYTLATR